MAKLSIHAGATSKSVGIFAQDSSSTTGAGLTGLVFNTASLTAYWYQPGVTAPAAITLATLSTITSAFSSGGFKEADATNMPGHYRLDIPNAVLTGATSALIELKGATNLAPIVLEIELTATDNQDGVHGGMSALPNTACTTNASLLTSGTGTDQLSVTTGRIDVGKFLGTTSAGVAGYAGIDWSHVNAPTTSVGLTGTTISTTQVITTVSGNVSGSVNSVVTGFPANFSSLSIDASGNVKIQGQVKKNTALAAFPMKLVLTSDHISAATGKTVACQRSIDGAAFANCATATATEIANGFYQVNLAAADLNGNCIIFRATATSCDPTEITIVTQP